MKFDVPTLVFILSLVGVTQVVALFIQYRVNGTYRGIGWWLLGSLAMSLGFVTLSLAVVDAVAWVSVISIPTLILGRACLFVGTSRYLGERLPKAFVYGSVLSFAAAYYFFLFVREDIAWRTIVGSGGIALFSLLNARILFRSCKGRYGTVSAFTGGLFLFAGLQLIFVILYTLVSGPMRSYLDYALPQVMIFIVPSITSILWTFGFILMVNQRLVSDNQAEQENLRLMFNARPDAALLIRLEDGVLVDVNQGYLQMTGFTREEILGRSAQEVCGWTHPEDHRAFLAAMKDRGECENLEFESRHRDGTGFIGMVSARILNLHDAPHILSVTRDITERRRAERERAELDATNQRLQKAESLGRMAGAIAHHFNNQLQTVLTNLEILGHAGGGTDHARVLARVKQATDRAAEMSGLMLVYLGQTTQEKAPLDLSELCRGALAAFRDGLPATLGVTEDLPRPGPTVLANGPQLRQALANLLRNALEALDAGRGTLQVRIRQVPAGDLPAGHRFPINWQPQAREYACLEVSDDGTGIQDGDIEKLFDPFYTTKFTGRGLGLPVVLGIAQAHGGAVSLSTRAGAGSSFRILLPLEH
ncbi:two-component system sensor histidine kinase NtrB [Mesoterricola silvestris]|uniref:histidine kinase n=1 Tax=Mesoterricola silvestris TaxID=2927979 RepID=A0AA48GH16_9BACT|nr:ATP-binding protein [Mesoterricola silvestris]BDU72701.1 hypothetical protein METEAL_18750 [Mesoterricola silvestris]